MNSQRRSRLAVPLVLGMLSGSAGLVGCQSGQTQPNDGPSGSGLLPPAPAADRSQRDGAAPPRSLPLSPPGRFVPPLPAA
ncbi:MAG TPA: hypothetical protein VML55_25330 [Planctomycetaceae bacterium]|nr:hypothetical protein [Planctomycetaceae bacterium]